MVAKAGKSDAADRTRGNGDIVEVLAERLQRPGEKARKIGREAGAGRGDGRPVASYSPPGQVEPKYTIADLRALATARGFKVERAMTGGDRWQILDKKGRAATDPQILNRDFSVDECVTYLKRLGGVMRHPIWRKC
jgi:hypothetical protein